MTELSWRIERHETLESTQDTLKSLAASGAGEGLVIQANAQSAGRGRHGRIWSSDAGNLYMSLLVRPDCAVARIGQLAFVAALALGASVGACLRDPGLLRLKWPNDVLLAGRKCAGILIEVEQTPAHALDWAVVGMGVNIVHAPGDVGASIAEHADVPVSLDGVRDDVLKNFAHFYALWRAQGFAPIRAAWLDMAHKKGEPLRVRLPDREYEGHFYDVDECGALILQDNALGLKTITAGDVFLQG